MGLVWRSYCGIPTPWGPMAGSQRQLCHSRLLAADIVAEFSGSDERLAGCSAEREGDSTEGW